jgi:predicted hotdog family 3-hydroxylacyl-ACP dehydratase
MNAFPDIAELIPHTGPMILLDRVTAFDEDSLSAELVVRAGLFGDGKTVPAWVGIEYMAQTIGAYAGMKAKLAGEPIRLGFLLGTRRYSGNVAEFRVGTLLTVRVDKIMQDEKLGAFECRIAGEGIEMTANLNVYQPPLNDTQL